MKRLLAFDLDGTLAESKQPIAPDMAALLARLLDVASAAVISGGDWPQFRTQVVDRLPAQARLDRLFIMPTTGTKLYTCRDGVWAPAFQHLFDAPTRDRILKALAEAPREAGLAEERTWGDRIEDRGSQITFSGLGQQAPLDAKRAWDPDGAKRRALRDALAKRLPDLSVATGGSTSIDITARGVNKAAAMRALADATGIPVTDMLFFGDAIYPGGNDDAVRAAGMDAIKVRDPAETMTAVTAAIACLA
ncbi:MAG: HAD-IIB family hydrolase [Sphingomonas fennica]